MEGGTDREIESGWVNREGGSKGGREGGKEGERQSRGQREGGRAGGWVNREGGSKGGREGGSAREGLHLRSAAAAAESPARYTRGIIWGGGWREESS